MQLILPYFPSLRTFAGMSERLDLLAQQLFQKELQDVALEEVQQLATSYPYFAPAQLLLSKKLKDENASEYQWQVKKAVLFFSDPIEFDVLLHPDKYKSVFSFEEMPEPVLEEPEQMPEELSIEAPLPEKENEEVLLPSEEIIESQPEAETEIEEPEPEIKLPSFKLTQPSPEQKSEETQPLAFEPFHTVDYFASLGIKLSKEEAKDRVGKQLKSFTEWLKTMKRLPATEQIKNLDTTSEKKVENLAAHSIEDTAIVTEAMAEVWAKQGNRQKAIEIYNKLSLLNPSKRAYFANRIEKLKKAT